MKIATWNINSVRLRSPSVQKFLQEENPDILCLQETKTLDEFFPHDDFRALGYEHIHIHGMKSYNGVAIISRLPFEQADIHHRVGKQDCRHIAVEFTPKKGAEKIRLHNVYIPAGGDIPDRIENEKFGHKLDFVDELADWFPQQENKKKNGRTIIVGDFNIAPLEHDVWSHKQLLKVVSHTPIEVEKLTRMQGNFGWVDAVRQFVPEQEKLYSWWSYRNRDWKKSNRGRRLDHIWVSGDLKTSLSGQKIRADIRDWPQPSDHVPVMIDLK